MREVRCLTKNIIAILSVVACIFILVSAIFVRPTIINTEYTITVDKTITGSDREVLSQEFEKYKNDLKQNYAENIEQFNSKFNLLLALVGIAVTVWVGLNIYNLVDRVQIDILAKKQKHITESISMTNEELKNLRTGIEAIKGDKQDFEKKTQESILALAEYVDKANKEKQELQQMVQGINESIKEISTQTKELQERNNTLDSAKRIVNRL